MQFEIPAWQCLILFYWFKTTNVSDIELPDKKDYKPVKLFAKPGIVGNNKRGGMVSDTISF